MSDISVLLEKFFTERLINQQKVSQNTVMSYRDTFKILFLYLKDTLKKNPSDILLSDFSSEMIGEFLNYLTKKRKNSERTCNTRLAAIHSFFAFAQYEEPQQLDRIKRILSIPQKKMDKREVNYLTDSEMEAILATPDRKTVIGRRDHALLTLAFESGLRVSELISLTIEQITWGKHSYIRCIGKGRKERVVPISAPTQKILKEWLKEHNGESKDPIFPSQRGKQLSRDAIEKLLKKYQEKAKKQCPTLKDKKVTPHVLRHTTAMRLLKADVDTAVIALYLGHESLETTSIYLKADLDIKENALKKVKSSKNLFKRYRPDDKVLAYLDSL